MRRNGKIILLLSLLVAFSQIGVLAAMIKQHATILFHGREVMLEITPVDPRDFLRGDYVTLRYRDLPRKSVFCSSAQPKNYVRLREGADGLWYFVEDAAQPFGDLTQKEVQIMGRKSGFISCSYVFGVERFYVPEDKGREIEELIRTRSASGEDESQPVTIMLAVSDTGQARIKALYYKNERLFEENWY